MRAIGNLPPVGFTDLDPPGVYTLVSLGVNAVVCINSDYCLQFSSCSKLRYNIVQQISIVRAMKQAP